MGTLLQHVFSRNLGGWSYIPGKACVQFDWIGFGNNDAPTTGYSASIIFNFVLNGIMFTLLLFIDLNYPVNGYH